MANWILKNGDQKKLEFTSFPYAFRSAHTAVRKAREAGQDTSTLIKQIVFFGPDTGHGERYKYSYADAAELARKSGLLNETEQLNTREFKKRF